MQTFIQKYPRSAKSNVPSSAPHYVTPSHVSCLHSRGLDQDHKKRNGTITAMFKFPKKPQRINILNYENCEFKIAANIYEGPVGNSRCIGQSSSTRSLDDDDRKRGILHMTVHGVVSQNDIIFTKSNVPPDKIFIEVVVDLKAKGYIGAEQNE